MPRKVTEQRLWNVSLFYLRRFPASVAGVRRMLDRRIRRWVKDGAEVVGDQDVLVTGIVERLSRAGYLDDEKLAVSKVASLRRGGASARAIGVKLSRAGISRELSRKVAAEEPTTDAEAVWTWARRKRLGVFRTSGREARREKDLAALVRAGFSFRQAREVVDAVEPP